MSKEVNLKVNTELTPIEPFLDVGNPQEKYDNLTDYFYDSISSFCFMMSRVVPSKFQSDTPDKHELNSSRQGVVALKKCVTLLKRQHKGLNIKPINLELRTYRKLHTWYFDSIINFIISAASDKHDKFKSDDDVKHLLTALNKLIGTLKEDIKNARRK